MARTAIEELREANRQLETGMAHLESGCGGAADVLCLRSALQLGSRSIKQMSTMFPPDTNSQDELSAYRRHLEKLREALPAMYAGLQTRKSRLQSALDAVHAGERWAQASRNSF